MNGAFTIGAIAMDAQQRALEVVANNIANINTTGFKRSAVQFSELLATAHSADGTVHSPDDLPAAFSGVTLAATPRIWTNGDLKLTGETMDVAIDGSGFIELMGSEGHTTLWRSGTLKINADGYLATSDGTALRGMISIPAGAGKLTIDPDGTVSATVDGETSPRQLGRIELVTVKDPDTLVALGGGCYETTEAGELSSMDTTQAGEGKLVQGALESSNVQLTDEMMALLLTQRAFAANAQVVQAGDQLMSIVNTLRR